MQTFTVDNEEQQKIAEWLAEHDKKCPHAGDKNSGAIGGRLTYCFTSTSIGGILKVKCACGSECDPTDYSSW